MVTILINLTGTLLLGLAALLNAPAAAPPDAPCQACQAAIIDAAAAPLSAAEEADLLFMREEEKLARDVYTAMYARWRQPIFRNIAASEQTHMNAILTLLNRYGLPDPAADAPGVFNNPELQALYDELVAQGNLSRVEALRVGVAIEEADIADLQASLAHTTHADIRLVYNNLLRGSRNHLRAFTRQLP